MYKLKDENLITSKVFNEDCSFIINQYIDYYNDVISKMVHEINNPLTLINSSIQIIELKYPDIQDIIYWNQLKKDVIDLIELVNNFKEIRNCIDVIISNDNLLCLIESVVNSLLPFAEESDVKLIVNVDEASKKYFINYSFDKIRLKQAFTNIIKNAIESAPRSYGMVCVLCYSSNKKLFINIKDNGKPIPNTLKEDIFNPYVTSKESGTGLGLPIAKSIISSHMGSIDIISTDEETSFKVSLPIYDLDC